MRLRQSPSAHARHLAVTTALLLMVGAGTTPLLAQAYPRRGSFEGGGEVFWIGGSDAGSATASETQNQTGPPSRLTLFETAARLRPAAGISGRIGFNLTRTFGVEGALTYSRPSIVTSISKDFEGAPDVTFSNSSLRQYFVDVGLVVHLNALRINGRTLPFVSASAGYLRQLTAEEVTVETGRIYQFGGGIKQMLGARQRIGVRIDARAGVRDGGFSFDQQPRRLFFVGGGGMFVVF